MRLNPQTSQSEISYWIGVNFRVDVYWTGFSPGITHKIPWFMPVVLRFPECSSSSMASEQEINLRLRSLHKDFDFLLDHNVVSTELYDELVSRIPRRMYPFLSLR